MTDVAVARVREFAEHLARAAGAIQRERYETDLVVRTKSAPIDLVTEVDHSCEVLIIEALRRERPGDAIVAEEGSGEDRAGAEWRWVIDPLDGTMNYAHGYPRFCVSIGVQRHGEPCVGVVYDPLLDELFAATRGAGATCNGRALRVSDERELGRALLATGFAYDVHKSPEDNLDHFAAFVKRVRGLRRDGSAALDLCYVAAGRFDGFWEQRLKPWDVAAGILIAREAGALVTDMGGGDGMLDSGDIVAATPALLAPMLDVIGSVAR